MNALAFLALAIVAADVVQLIFPGRGAYHTGWYNVGIVALCALSLLAARKLVRNVTGLRARVALSCVAFGVVVTGLAGVASGLLGPDNRTVVGAPGERVRVDDAGGFLDFPLAQSEGTTPSSSAVTFDRGGARIPIGGGNRNVGSFILRATPRDVVYVEARDSKGGHLTVTQPTGSAFLSPVLLMQQRQSIAGMTLPYDSFAVPAAHRIVKAVLFTPQQAATLRGMAGLSVPAVLFAVDDENDRPLPQAIALVPDGTTVSVGGLALHAVVLSYPAIEIVAVPALSAVAIGGLLVLGGLIALARTPSSR